MTASWLIPFDLKGGGDRGRLEPESLSWSYLVSTWVRAFIIGSSLDNPRNELVCRVIPSRPKRTTGVLVEETDFYLERGFPHRRKMFILEGGLTLVLPSVLSCGRSHKALNSGCIYPFLSRQRHTNSEGRRCLLRDDIVMIACPLSFQRRE